MPAEAATRIALFVDNAEPLAALVGCLPNKYGTTRYPLEDIYAVSQYAHHRVPQRFLLFSLDIRPSISDAIRQQNHRLSHHIRSQARSVLLTLAPAQPRAEAGVRIQRYDSSPP